MSTGTFYFDLGSPYAYLASERIDDLLPGVEWQPILLGGIFQATGRSSWALADAECRRTGMADVEARAAGRCLPPMHWPDPWPGNTLYAMRATVYAFTAGRGREFTQRAFRAAFQHGIDLSVPVNVLEIADHAGIEPAAVEAATADPQVKQALRSATDAALEHGVIGVPTVALGGDVLWGDDRLDEAAALFRPR